MSKLSSSTFFDCKTPDSPLERLREYLAKLEVDVDLDKIEHFSVLSRKLWYKKVEESIIDEVIDLFILYSKTKVKA
ncbi:MAG: hypothetical protein QG567_1965 [Campylobacterota bacterium]|nr:hypothetical protein [Campylobacterota bacterium]